MKPWRNIIVIVNELGYFPTAAQARQIYSRSLELFVAKAVTGQIGQIPTRGIVEETLRTATDEVMSRRKVVRK